MSGEIDWFRKAGNVQTQAQPAMVKQLRVLGMHCGIDFQSVSFARLTSRAQECHQSSLTQKEYLHNDYSDRVAL